MVNKPTIVTQPHLGSIEKNVKPHMNMGGFLARGKVLRVHHKHSTVDVELIYSKDVISSDPTVEGKYAARMIASYAHFDQDLLLSSGVIEPIQEGSIVLLAFLDGNKARPIILGCFHDTQSVDNNVLPMQYPIDEQNSIEERKEALKYLKVFPSQLYHRVDGEGGVEIVHPSKTFLKIDADLNDDMDDSHTGYDHDDLQEKDPTSNNTRFGRTEESLLPIRLLFSHRSSFMNSVTTWLKFFIDRTGLFRLTRDNNDGHLSYAEITPEGDISLRRQDSSVHGEGNASEIKIESNGDTNVIHLGGNKFTITGNQVSITHIGGHTITVDSDNISLSHDIGSSITMNSNGDIILHAYNRVTTIEDLRNS